MHEWLVSSYIFCRLPTGLTALHLAAFRGDLAMAKAILRTFVRAEDGAAFVVVAVHNVNQGPGASAYHYLVCICTLHIPDRNNRWLKPRWPPGSQV
jgi:hypothetical protein